MTPENWPEFDEDRDIFDCDEPDEYEDAMQNCHGWFDPNPETGVFVCGAAGSEDCDECPFNDWCGHTNKEIDEMDDTDSPFTSTANHLE